MTHSPTIRRKRLSTALRQLRRDNHMTIEDVAARLSWDPSKISRMENNEWKLPRPAEIEQLCDVYNATPATRDALVTLARQARERGWWEQYKDVLGGALPGLEAEAIRIWQYQPMLIPGLLQTPDYKRAICKASLLDEAETARRVQARIARQQILHQDNPPLLWVVLDEAALRKPVGGHQVMADQVAHLIEMSSKDNIGIQVIMDDVGAHPGMEGPIVLMHYVQDPSIVYIEHAGTGDLYLEDPGEVTRYVARWQHVTAAASDVPGSFAYLERRLEQLKGEGS
jgi:transcriptional regulator with XRE-family HTH domain